jgi:hypothetical protein
MITSRHGFTRCPSCGAHVQVADLRSDDEKCRFCEAPAKVARGGIIATSLFAISLSAAACSSEPPPDEQTTPDNGGGGGDEEPTPVPAYGVSPDPEPPPDMQTTPEDPPVVALYGVAPE